MKTYPIPSQTYDELVCTAGVLEDGSFIRLYPINFRDLPYSQQYRKYQWISVRVQRHDNRDRRKESYRPDCSSIQALGEPIPAGKPGWPERSRYILANKAQSIEDLKDQADLDRTSLGIIKPKSVFDLVWTPDDPEWKPGFKKALAQARIWEDRTVSREPPKKLPFKFQYLFECDDPRCKRNHRMMIEDWEVGALYWRLIGQGATPDEAAAGVKKKFLGEVCGPDKDTHFYMGTLKQHPKSWVVIGVYWPKRVEPKPVRSQLSLDLG